MKYLSIIPLTFLLASCQSTRVCSKYETYTEERVITRRIPLSYPEAFETYTEVNVREHCVAWKDRSDWPKRKRENKQ